MGESEKEKEKEREYSTSLAKKCSHLAKKQRAKFYILRRCIAMLVCWHERNDHKDEDEE